jgi:hypothetical protein
MRSSTRALLSREVGSEAAGPAAAPEPSLAGRQDPVPQDAWQRVDARSTPLLDLKLVCGGAQSAGYRQRHHGLCNNGSCALCC